MFKHFLNGDLVTHDHETGEVINETLGYLAWIFGKFVFAVLLVAGILLLGIWLIL